MTNTGTQTTALATNAGQNCLTSGASSPNRNAIADHNATGSMIESVTNAISCFLRRDSCSTSVISRCGTPGRHRVPAPLSGYPACSRTLAIASGAIASTSHAMLNVGARITSHASGINQTTANTVNIVVVRL